MFIILVKSLPLQETKGLKSIVQRVEKTVIRQKRERKLQETQKDNTWWYGESKYNFVCCNVYKMFTTCTLYIN